MGLSVAITYNSSFPIISGDRAPDLSAGSESSPGITIFNSVYEYLDFNISLEFSYQTNDENPISYEVTSVVMEGPIGVTCTNFGSICTISGNIGNIFNEQWEFVLRNGLVQKLPINNTEDWIAVTKWYPASFSEELLNYSFVATLETNETVTISIPQYVYWRWQNSLNKLKEFVSKGEI